MRIDVGCPDVLGLGGVVVFMNTCAVLKGAAGRSEWSAKRERSEREADHERRRGSGNVRLIAVLTNTR